MSFPVEPVEMSVRAFVRLVNDTLGKAFPPHLFFVEGEITDVRITQNKWVSFDLKDLEEPVILKGFGTIWNTPQGLAAGMRVRVTGSPKIYERFGSLSLNVEKMELVGEGELKRAYEALKARLAAEGLFDPSRKRILPPFVSKIGLITSRDAAAYGDFLRILRNRFADIEVIHAHVSVQGVKAVEEILAAIARFQVLPEGERPEVLVLTRGGGGLEELHAFNDERVARAIFASTIPFVSAIGHERDECLTDFVADVRASTPSNAAERLVPDRREIDLDLTHTLAHIERALERVRRRPEDVLSHVRQLGEIALARTEHRLEQRVERLDERTRLLVERLTHRLERSTERLERANPEHVLKRGYSLVRQEGRVVKSVHMLDTKQPFEIRFSEGMVTVGVTPPPHQSSFF